MTPKVRKTWVVSFLDEQNYLKQRYCRTYQKAKAESAWLSLMGYEHRNISFWIDGAEALRLARLGYRYDFAKDRAVKMKHYPRKFLQTIDSMPQEQVEELYLDYRNFDTSDEVIAYYNERRKQE